MYIANLFRLFFARVNRIRYGLDTSWEFILRYVDRVSYELCHKNTKYYRDAHIKRLRRLFLNEGDKSYHIKDIRIPILTSEDEATFFNEVFGDTLGSYYFFNDTYDEETFDMCDKFLFEGFYGLVNDKVNVTVKPGDIVIDAGSWIGDFAAYASAKGAGKIYAFEPTDYAFRYVKRTAELQKNIIPVKKGLSNEGKRMNIYVAFSGSSYYPEKAWGINSEFNSSEVVSLDDFVQENNLERVDFIKSDIEGFERNMLEGAQETLRRFAPKLALCTYHFPDDPQVMAELILKANPKYNIVQKRMKLFASVPK